MILTKQLQVVIQSSLAQGRDFEDVRDILLKQGFQDADISELFSQYRGAAGAVQQPKIVTEPVVVPLQPQPEIAIQNQINTQTQTVTQTSTPKVASKDILFNKDFVHPDVKPNFVPVGFESEPSPQANVQEDVQKFMNVGTNTQTASDLMNREQAVSAQKLPAPGTTLLPIEMQSANATRPAFVRAQTSAPKVLDETGLAPGEVAQQVTQEVPQANNAENYINVGFAGMPEIEKVLAEEQAKKIEKSPWPMVLALLILIGLMGGFYYWFFILKAGDTETSETDKLLQEIQDQKVQEAQPVAPPQPIGPLDPFTNMPLEVQ